MGALVIAEDVVTQEEALACLRGGADLGQGSYFARPEPSDRANLHNGLPRVIETGELLKKSMLSRFVEQKRASRRYCEIANRICARLGLCTVEQYDEALAVAIEGFPQVECAYVLHESGMQISATVFNPQHEHRSRSALFAPASAGTDQSTKDYFIFIDDMRKQYVTDPYISLATGARCVTISTLIKTLAGRNAVICVDFDVSVPLQMYESASRAMKALQTKGFFD